MRYNGQIMVLARQGAQHRIAEIETEITQLKAFLNGQNEAPKRRSLSPAARKAIGIRMKAYWANKKGPAGKSRKGLSG